MKKQKNKVRNYFFIVMLKHCKGGLMRNKKSKRVNGKNKQQAFLLEDY